MVTDVPRPLSTPPTSGSSASPTSRTTAVSPSGEPVPAATSQPAMPTGSGRSARYLSAVARTVESLTATASPSPSS